MSPPPIPFIQQADRPLQLYSRPANQFVETFIGSPAMNLVSGAIQDGRFVAEGVNYPLGRQLPMALQSGQWILGFRPEDLLLDPSAPRLAEASIQLIERMGFETVVHYSLAGISGVARLRGDHDLAGLTSLDLRLPVSAWHLFAVDSSGKRVLSGTE